MSDVDDGGGTGDPTKTIVPEEGVKAAEAETKPVDDSGNPGSFTSKKQNASHVLKGNESINKEEHMEIDDQTMFEQFEEVSLEQKVKATTEVVRKIKEQTKFSPTQIHILIEPLSCHNETVMKECKDRVMENILLKKERAMLLSRNSELQDAMEVLNRQTEHDKVFGNWSKDALVSCLERNNIGSVDDMEDMFQRLDSLEIILQTKEQILQAAKREVHVSRATIISLRENGLTMDYKLRMLNEQHEELKRKLSNNESNSRPNSNMRQDDSTPRRTTSRVNFASDERNPSSPVFISTPKSKSQREYSFSGQGMRNETARGYCEETGEIVDDSHPSHTYNSDVYQQRNDMMSQNVRMNYMDEAMHIRMEQSVPEPPKYTAETNSVDLESFEKIFMLKYGRFSSEYQITLLESKFLSGKALRIYKGLRASEKETAKGVLTAIRKRLKITASDESLRAKFKFDALKMYKNQSVEDLCLSIDEIARVAYRGIPENQLSSIKVAKLSKELMENGSFKEMIHIIENYLQNVPEEDHYETYREQAIRYQFSEREQTKKREMCKPEQGDKKRQNTNINFPQVQQKQQTMTDSLQPVSRFCNDSSGFASESNSPENSQLSRGFEGAPRNWRTQIQRQQHNQTTENGLVFQRCSECKQTGCHDPACSRAPAAKKQDRLSSIVCFRCNEKGHYAPACPQKTQQTSMDDETKPSVVSSVEKRIKERETDPIEGLVKGFIGKTEVNVLLDSGACTSLISSYTWNQLVHENGTQWGYKAVVKNPQMINVVAANQTPIKLLSQVKVATTILSSTNHLKFFIDEGKRDYVILGRDQFDKVGVKVNVVPKRTNTENIYEKQLESDENMVDYKSDCFLLKEKHYDVVKEVEKRWLNGEDHSKGLECSRTLSAHEENVLYGGEICSKGLEGTRTSYTHGGTMNNSGVDEISTNSSSSGKHMHSGGYPEDTSRTLMAKKMKQQIVPTKENGHVVIDNMKSLNDSCDKHMNQRYLERMETRMEITSLSFHPYTEKDERENKRVKAVDRSTPVMPKSPDRPGLKKKDDGTCGDLPKQTALCRNNGSSENLNNNSSLNTDYPIRPLKDPPYPGNLIGNFSTNSELQVHTCRDNLETRRTCANWPTCSLLFNEISTIVPEAQTTQKESKDSPKPKQLWRTVYLKPSDIFNARVEGSGSNVIFKTYLFDQ